MPSAPGMQQQGEEDVAGSSLGESNPLVGSAGRPGKRPRAADAAATQEQQQPAGAGPAMHLRSAQKRLLAAEAAARTDSAVGSSQQLDRTDSCGGPRGGSADAPTTAAGPPAAGPPLAPRHHAQGRQHAQGEQSARHTAPAAEAAAAQPPAKRRRVMRTGVPAPLPAYELRRGFERPSPPFRHVAVAVGSHAHRLLLCTQHHSGSAPRHLAGGRAGHRSRR